MSRAYDDDNVDPRAPFPGGVKVAGIIWIVFGVLGLISAAFNFVAGAAQVGARGPEATGQLCGVGCVVLFALVFLMVGIQTVKGTAKDVLGNGVGSIVFAVIYFGVAAVLLAGGFAAGNMPPGRGGQPPVDRDMVRTISLVSGVFAGFLGMLLLLAGILALSNRTAYKAWRQARGLELPPRRPRDDYDEEDDRPRRRRRDEDEDDYDDEDRPRPRRDNR